MSLSAPRVLLSVVVLAGLAVVAWHGCGSEVVDPVEPIPTPAPTSVEVEAEPVRRERVPRAAAEPPLAAAEPPTETPDYDPLFEIEPRELPGGALLWTFREGEAGTEAWVLDPDGDRRFHRFAACPPGPMIQSRTADGRLLAGGFVDADQSEFRWVLLDPKTGRERPIDAPGTAAQIWATDLGIVTSGDDGALLHPFDDSEPVPLFEGRRASMVATFDGGFVYRAFRMIDANVRDDRSEVLARADADGTTRELLPPGTLKALTQRGGDVIVSPSGDRFATTASWGYSGEDDGLRDDPEGGTLTGPCIRIHDARTGEVLRTIEGFDISVSPFSSQMPRVEMRWMDDRRVRFTQSDLKGDDYPGPDARAQFVELDVVTGERLALRDAGPVELQLPSPPADPDFRTRRLGPFRIGSVGDVYVGDDAAPTITAAEVSVNQWMSRRAFWPSPDHAHMFVQLEVPDGTAAPDDGLLPFALLTGATRRLTEFRLPKFVGVGWTAPR